MGYWAAIECRRVHEDRPRASTSGGHSDVSCDELLEAAVRAPAVKPVADLEVDFFAP